MLERSEAAPLSFFRHALGLRAPIRSRTEVLRRGLTRYASTNPRVRAASTDEQPALFYRDRWTPAG
jgi:hypothetical protein